MGAIVCDKASTLFNIAYVYGCGLAPMIGGLLADYRNFTFASDVMGFTGLTLLAAYTIIAIMLHEERGLKKEKPHILRLK